GTTPHLMGVMLSQKENIDMIHIPYKSGSQGVVDLMAGRLHFYAGVPTEVIPNVRTGRLRAIAIMGPERSALLPDVPTSTEQGYGYAQAASWSSVVLPKGTPSDIVEKVSNDIRKIIKLPSFREKFE